MGKLCLPSLTTQKISNNSFVDKVPRISSFINLVIPLLCFSVAFIVSKVVMNGTSWYYKRTY